MKKVMETSMAVAWAARLCRPEVIPMYPITPQTHIVEHLAEFINDGQLDSEMIHVESEHSAMSAALGAQAAGVRTFTATASQGLALMHEMLFVVSGMRLPVVMAVANRALSAPISIWNDHQDSIASRDSGWIQLFVESSQEALDTVIMAYMIAENAEILTPVMVCLDGFTLSHVYEPVEIPSQREVDAFLPAYKPIHAFTDPKRPTSQGPIGFPNIYMEFKKAQQDAMARSIPVIKQVNSKFRSAFGRAYGDGLLECYRMKDAEYAVIGMGTIMGTSRVVVDELRKQGKRVGLIKLRSFRPFPQKELNAATAGLKGLAVVDRDISIGQEGALLSEIRSALFGRKLTVNGFIAGLGGRDVTPGHIREIFSNLDRPRETRWMF
ncbi:MAG: pyruvate ferredoxin oxidoreductase [archaeon]